MAQRMFRDVGRDEECREGEEGIGLGPVGQWAGEGRGEARTGVAVRWQFIRRGSKQPRCCCSPSVVSSPARSRHRYSYQEYLAYERDSGLEHEFEDGEILAMAGGSRRHNALVSRVSAALEAARRPGCVALQKIGVTSGSTIS
jgi:hypothetical protein